MYSNEGKIASIACAEVGDGKFIKYLLLIAEKRNGGKGKKIYGTILKRHFPDISITLVKELKKISVFDRNLVRKLSRNGITQFIGVVFKLFSFISSAVENF